MPIRLETKKNGRLGEIVGLLRFALSGKFYVFDDPKTGILAHQNIKKETYRARSEKYKYRWRQQQESVVVQADT